MILPNASGCNFLSGYNFFACQSFVNFPCVKLAPQGLFPDQSASKTTRNKLFWASNLRRRRFFQVKVHAKVIKNTFLSVKLAPQALVPGQSASKTYKTLLFEHFSTSETDAARREDSIEYRMA